MWLGRVGWATRIITFIGPPTVAWTAIADPWWETMALAVVWMFTGQMCLATAYNHGTIDGMDKTSVFWRRTRD